MEIIENRTKDLKFFSLRAIGIATFIGSPLVAGYLIGENFKALDKPSEGRKALAIGIVFTILLFFGLFLIPEEIIEKIPRQFFPIIYGGITWGIAQHFHGDILKTHKENGNSFFSVWRAVGIGAIGLLIIVIGLFGIIYFETQDPVYDLYDNKMKTFTKNETESLTFFDNVNTKDSGALLIELDTKVVPKWKMNIGIINELNNSQELPEELRVQNDLLMQYSELRLEAFALIRKIIFEDTDKYNQELDETNTKIEDLLEKLN